MGSISIPYRDVQNTLRTVLERLAHLQNIHMFIQIQYNKTLI
jgi:hypothetical protein